ncbi:MAG: cytochrome P450 [Polyangiales bacterium]
MSAAPPLAPGALPLLGHLWAMYRDHLGLMLRAERAAGQAFRVRIGPGNETVFLLGPASLELLKHRASSSVGLSEQVTALFGDSMITRDGADHARARTAFASAFSPKGLGASSVGPELARLVDDHVAAAQRAGPAPLLATTRELALRLIFHVVGVPADDLRAFRVAFEDFSLAALPFTWDLPGSPRRRSERARRWLGGRFGAILDAAAGDGAVDTLVGRVVRENTSRESPLTREGLAENLRLLVLAGHETNASVLAWMTARLATDDAAWGELTRESRDAATPATPDALTRHPYAEALFRECVRLHPPACFDTRRLTEPMRYAGFELPAGSSVSVSITHLARHPELYPDPDRFEVSRWLGRRVAPGAHETIGFGAGPHFCLGYHLALMEGVQYAVALGRARRRPLVTPSTPSERYLPFGHPDPRATLRWS